MREIGGDLLFVFPPPTVRACGVNGGAIVGAGPAPSKADGPGREGPVSAVILDVTGHGIAAALMVNRMVGELERLFAENPYARPGDVLAALNRYVHLTLARNGLFATALCLRANPARGMIEWASGGNPPAYLRRPDGRIRTLAPTAAMLGILDPSEYDPAPDQLPFAVGDVVCAYTDGAFEATDAKGSPIGTAGVSRLLSAAAAEGLEPDQYAAAMLARIAAHRGGLPDDDTLIVVLSHVNVEEEEKPAERSASAGERAATADAAGVPSLPQDPAMLIPVGKLDGTRARYSVGPAPAGGAGEGDGPGDGDGPGEGVEPGGVGPGPGRGEPPPPPGAKGDRPGAGAGAAGAGG
jgi:hypothetical protein